MTTINFQNARDARMFRHIETVLRNVDCPLEQMMKVIQGTGGIYRCPLGGPATFDLCGIVGSARADLQPIEAVKSWLVIARHRKELSKVRGTVVSA